MYRSADTHQHHKTPNIMRGMLTWCMAVSSQTCHQELAGSTPRPAISPSCVTNVGQVPTHNCPATANKQYNEFSQHT